MKGNTEDDGNDAYCHRRYAVALRIPAGVTHSFTVGGEQPMEIVQVYSPGGPEQRFRAWEQQTEGDKP